MVQEAKVTVANIYKQSRVSNPIMCFLVVAKVTFQMCVCIDYSLCVHVGCNHISIRA